MNQLRYHSPAEEWVEGLPLGNGRIGLMAYGSPGKERFALNADNLFRRRERKHIRTAKLMPRLRQLVLEGRGEEADALFLKETAHIAPNCNAYQPFAELQVVRECVDALEYVRWIDLDEAMAGVRYQTENGKTEWRMFASAADQLLVWENTMEVPANLRIGISREFDEECAVQTAWTDMEGVFRGRFIEGTEFVAVLRIQTDGQTCPEPDHLSIRKARKLEIRAALVAAFDGEDPESCCRNILAAAQDKDIAALCHAHAAEYQSLYGTMALKLDADDERDTDVLYAEAMRGNPAPRLSEQMFAFARYLLISSSRHGCLPVNLQGLWCSDLHPMWDCGYTTDMNVQMAYWMAEPANLSVCHEALFDWIDDNIPEMERQCEAIFGVRGGAYIPQYTDRFMIPTCWRDFGAFQVLWSGAAPWLARHYYEHWRYSGDNEFARRRAFPFMKRCMNFYLQFLQSDENGRLILAPSANPENWTESGGQLVNTATMDLALAHELAKNLLEINERLEIEDPMAQQWAEVDARLAEYPVDEEGALREWLDFREAIDPGHRHLSHLYGVFPARLFQGKPQLEEAAMRAIEKRLAGGIGHSASWSFAWYACLFARLEQGNAALRFLDHLVKGTLLPNLLTAHNDWRESDQYSHMVEGKIFQIDALLGSAAAMCEMLAAEREGTFALLPALPERWRRKGSVHGLRMYGGREISMDWSEGEVVRLEITSNGEEEVKVRFPDGTEKQIRTKRRMT